MKLTLKRIALKETYCIGKLYINDVYFCDTIEDTVRDNNKDGENELKIFGKTAIPYGTYQIIMNKSPKFQRVLPRLMNVKGFDGVLIHKGNTEIDSSGCIIVGENKIKGKVINSTVYENKLVSILSDAYNKGERIDITII